MDVGALGVEMMRVWIGAALLCWPEGGVSSRFAHGEWAGGRRSWARVLMIPAEMEGLACSSNVITSGEAMWLFFFCLKAAANGSPRGVSGASYIFPFHFATSTTASTTTTTLTRLPYDIYNNIFPSSTQYFVFLSPSLLP
mmetsp:Transcript_12348/g.19946  ORF Transcript_12348/g.19946 Transcript_12348/m.19946 type:complete len:140 (+) Transcript_12348:741-1160(+)